MVPKTSSEIETTCTTPVPYKTLKKACQHQLFDKLIWAVITIGPDKFYML